MSYAEQKRARDLALISALHGRVDLPMSESGFDGGARFDPEPHHVPDYLTMSQRGVFGPYPSEADEPGWPVEYEVPVEAIFPWLEPDWG